MIQIVYVSAAFSPFTSEALKHLLRKARARNAVYNVTGMLLYHSGSFLQVLEGFEQSVDLIYNSIQRDPRHSQHKILVRQTIAVPEFQEWAMGFVDTSQWPVDTPGMVEYHRVLPQLSSASTEAKRYLRFFHQGLCRQSVGA